MQKEALNLSLEEWQQATLRDDALFSLVAARLKEGNQNEHLPDFSLVPTMTSNKTGQTLFSLRIIESMHVSGEVAEVEPMDADTSIVTTHKIGFGGGIFKDIDVAFLDKEKDNRLNMQPSFVAAMLGREDISDITPEETAEVGKVALRYDNSVFRLFDTLDKRGVEWDINSVTKMIETTDELSRKFQLREDVQ